MRHLSGLLVLWLSIWLGCAATAVAQGVASPNDTARFLAGLPLDASSPLRTLAGSQSGRVHTAVMSARWATLERRQLLKVRDWSARNVSGQRETLFYLFSGPDFLYANAFFPNARTFVLAGLEPVGPMPDVTALKGGQLAASLGRFRKSISHLTDKSYFITSQMGSQLRGGLSGTLPVLYAFLARSGKEIREVRYITLAPDGAISPFDASAPGARPRAVKIDFAGADGREQTLYYFSTDLTNNGVAASGFLAFCARLAPGDAFIKSASYLLHGREFSAARNFLLDHSHMILQDDTGIPIVSFRAEQWQLQPYGRYIRPIAVFSRAYQSRMAQLFKRGRPGAMGFGIGYKWKQGQSHLVRAIRRDGRPERAELGAR